MPVAITDADIEALKAAMPELPDSRKTRFINDYQLSDYDADLLSASIATATFFEAAANAGGDAKLAANWVMGELAAKLNAEEKDIANSPVSAAQLAN